MEDTYSHIKFSKLRVVIKKPYWNNYQFYLSEIAFKFMFLIFLKRDGNISNKHVYFFFLL